MAAIIAVSVTLIGIFLSVVMVPAIGRLVMRGHPESNMNSPRKGQKAVLLGGVAASCVAGAVVYLLISVSQN